MVCLRIDGESWTDIGRISNNELSHVFTEPVSARYIRIYSDVTGLWAAIREVTIS